MLSSARNRISAIFQHFKTQQHTMAGPPVVAVAGATGTLGKELVEALLDPRHQGRFKDIIVLTRNADTPTVKGWIEKGATARNYVADDDSSISAAFSGVDILINVLASRDDGFKSKLVEHITSPSSSIKLYLPSEFGVDHYLHDFQHPEWDKKKAHYEAVSKRKDLKTCLVFPGLFMEASIGPWFGLNTKEGKYEFVGSGKTPVSFTSISDIGRAVASALANISISDFPEKLYISGESVSLQEIAHLMSAAGAGKIETSSVDLAAYKQKTFETIGLDPASYLRFLMEEGKIDNKDGNDNDLVNPGIWRWKTMKDYAVETSGRPWADY